MPRKPKVDTTSHWHCLKCPQTITVYIPMYDAPTHHCPSPIARNVREYVLKEGYPLEKRPKKEKT